MASAASENTRSILAGQERLSEAVGRQSEKFAEALGSVNVAIAGLAKDVGNLTDRVQDLTKELRRVDNEKASRNELKETETRIERSVAEIRTSASFEAGKLSNEVTRRMDAMDGHVESLSNKVDELNGVRWKVVGVSSTISALIGSGLAAVIVKAMSH